MQAAASLDGSKPDTLQKDMVQQFLPAEQRAITKG